MQALSGGGLRLIDRPILFMQARTASEAPRLYSALSAVVINAMFVGATGMLAQARVSVLAPGLTEPASSSLGLLPVPVMLLTAAVVGLVVFALQAGAVVTFDMLTTYSTGLRRWRLVELAALSYWPQLLWSVPALACTWWFYEPPPMVLRGGADVFQTALRYAEQRAGEPFQIVMTTTQQMAGLWLVALHAVALRVVSGFTVGGTLAAGVVLAILYMGVPVAVRAAVQGTLF